MSQVFRRIDRLIQAKMGFSVRTVLRSKNDAGRPVAETHAIIFTMHISLSKMLISMGLNANAILSFSVGEIPAGYLSGAYSLEDAVSILATISRVHDSGVGLGKMLVLIGLPLSEIEEISAQYEGRVCVGARFAPKGFALAGPTSDLKKIASRITDEKIFVKFPPAITLPFHSHLLDPFISQYFPAINDLPTTRLVIRWFSSVKGSEVSSHDINLTFWKQNINGTANSYEAIQASLRADNAVFIELNTHVLYSRSVNDEITNSSTPGYAFTLFDSPEHMNAQVISAVGKVYVNGGTVNWNKFFGPNAKLVDLTNVFGDAADSRSGKGKEKMSEERSAADDLSSESTVPSEDERNDLGHAVLGSHKHCHS